MSAEEQKPVVPESAGTRKPWGLIAGVAAVTAIVAFGLGRVTAPGASSDTVAVTTPPASTAPVEPEATGPSISEPEQAAPPSGSVAMGQEGNSNGLKLTVRTVTEAPSVQFVTGESLTPPKGGKIILVETKGVNDTKNGIDLTCSFAVRADLLDSEGRRFEGVNDVDLYSIKGNPGCNDDVQPGFPFNMTWAYIVPKEADVTEFQFSSIPKDFEAEEGPVVTVPVTLS